MRGAARSVPSNLGAMPVDVVVLVATAVLAVVAVGAAVVAVTAARRASRPAVPPAVPEAHEPADAPRAGPVVTSTALVVHEADRRPPELQPRVVEGRVVVPPTQDQVVATALGRPQVRVAVLARGVAHALRPESRDRIAALMRREYRQRRRERQRAGRRAVRAANPGPTPAADQWLGEQR